MDAVMFVAFTTVVSTVAELTTTEAFALDPRITKEIAKKKLMIKFFMVN
jgi:hypothetical protein